MDTRQLFKAMLNLNGAHWIGATLNPQTQWQRMMNGYMLLL